MRTTHGTAVKRVGACGILATGVFIASSLAAAGAAERYVNWTNQVNVTAHGATLQKSGGCEGCEDAGAISQEMIRSGNGYVEFSPGEANTFWFAGLSHQNASTRFSDIDFAFRFNGAGTADVMENGVYQGGDTRYATGDVFRVALVNGRIEYSKNGQLIHVSQKIPHYPLVLDTALGSRGATIENARMETGQRLLTGDTSRSGRFNSMDYNRDGVISRDEWEGSQRAFNQRDLNGDGVLTRRELLAGEPGAVATSGEMIYVDPRTRWTDTGIFVEAGDTITFDAEGTIQMSTNPNDTATPNGSHLGRRAENAPIWQASAGALIARIGNSQPMTVGDRRTIARAPVSGNLYLGVNDDFLGDNSGEYRVSVTIENR
jgi:hypothetical protein